MSADLKIKVCGIRDQAHELDRLGVDYIGHIFWEGSSRHLSDETAKPFKEQQLNAKRVGVFVNPSIDEIQQRCEKYALDAVQLHGAESPDFCKGLRSTFEGEIWKAFAVDDSFDFESASHLKRSLIASSLMHEENYPEETELLLIGVFLRPMKDQQPIYFQEALVLNL